MENQWYYTKNNQQQGPVSPEQLKQLAASGQLQPSDLVWKEGMGQWVEGRKIKGLFSAPAAPNPQSPPNVPQAGAVPQQWYYVKNGQRQGPVSTDQIKQLLASGQLQPSDLAWKEGMSQWVAAQAVGEFVAALPSQSGLATTYAGFWKRFAAAIIDQVVAYVGCFVVGIILGLILAVGGADVATANGMGFVLGIVSAWMYFAVMESSPTQATLGKMAIGVKVSDLTGRRISFGRATGRYFGKIISGLLLGIGFIMVAFTEKKQGLHDILAGCLVVNK